ncbi:L-threonine 3-dehydrogenase [Antarctobacter heliothermus]|uniref:L-threonine 3-dehydrogenase n=1 Tax=Antarctobacter heliothermus TaxID=74033 RepID=A0A222EA56_9RHOB|nr:L-idonate 5-dehydrogenase [Antarctobacter heliothermus]ASP23056.1 L-threonine 3-dehydrogenase [Antarctobacter heliothermus]
MKTIVAHGAHDLRIEEKDMPTPGPGQVLIRLESGGICGSDLHYYHQGGFGPVRLKEPMILGHEVAGKIETLGPNVTSLALGQRVAVSPSRPCHACRFCHAGQPNHCLNMRFYGSAMPFPHIQGAFREYLVADVAQCAPADDLTAGEAAMAEPLAVVLHAAKRAGDLLGKRVLVTGCGPIGALAVLVARAAGAAEIVATDLTDFTLKMATQVGADRVVNMGTTPDGLSAYTADKGQIDVLFECSGAAPALIAAIPAMRPGGIIMQLGLGGDMTLPVQALTAKELQLRGSFRFHEEFFTAVDLMRSGRIDVKPLITHEVGLDQAEDGFKLASDRTQAMKAQIRFS